MGRSHVMLGGFVTALMMLSAAARAQTYELWASGTVTGGEKVIARYNGSTGEDLGYFLKASDGLVGTLPGSAGAEILTMAQIPSDGRIHVEYNDAGNFLTAGYDLDGTNMANPIISGPTGNWFHSNLGMHSRIQDMEATADHIYIVSFQHAVAGSGVTAGHYVWRFNHDGTPSGTQGADAGAQFSATPIDRLYDVAIDSAGNVYASSGKEVYRFNSLGQNFGPGGVGDDTPWLSAATLGVEGNSGSVASIAVDRSNNLYLAGDAGGTTQGFILRYNAAGEAAPTAGFDGANVVVGWDNYGGKSVIFPEDMVIGPDGYLYVANNYKAGTTDELEILRWDPSDGSLVDVGGFANLGDANALLNDGTYYKLMFVTIPEPSSMALLLIGGALFFCRKK